MKDLTIIFSVSLGAGKTITNWFVLYITFVRTKVLF